MQFCKRAGELLIHKSLLILVLIFSSAALAQGPKPARPAPSKEKPTPETAANVPAVSHALTKDDVSAFLDGIVPLQLAREDIAGAVVVVVKDGAVLFAKGYGYSDVEKKTPVSVDDTLFRPGSVSKLFTWTAVMQQYEQGKLDLDRDINTYLDFKVPATYPQPITIRDLMTHTPGFEESIQEAFVRNEKDLVPLRTYVTAHMPARIFPPFTVPAYSNYGATIAGYIVQRLSGQPFDDYIDDHIFKPLGMTHTTFRQPLPASLAPLMSKGYAAASGPAKEFETIEVEPEGSASASGADMAKFIIAHLQGGEYQGQRILKPETAHLMHSRQFGVLDNMNGMALGFYEETRNGHRIIGHGGDTEYFHSDLHLIEDANLGFFVSYNSAGKGENRPREALWSAFLDRYFPYSSPAPAAPANATADAQLVPGTYIVSRRFEKTILKFLALFGPSKVFQNSDGTVSVNDLKDLNGEPKKFRPIGNLTFRDVNSESKIAFKRDVLGRFTLVTDFPVFIFQKAGLADNATFNVPLIVGALIIMALNLVLWPIAILFRRHYHQPLILTPQQKRRRMLVRLVCLFDLVCAIALPALLLSTEAFFMTTRYNGWLHLILFIGWLGFVGTIVVVYNAIAYWREKQWVWARIGYTLTALASLVFFWTAIHWNVLQWNVKF